MLSSAKFRSILLLVLAQCGAMSLWPAQFPALVADASPPALAGGLMSLRTALDSTLTMFTVRVTPLVAGAPGWPVSIKSQSPRPGRPAPGHSCT